MVYPLKSQSGVYGDTGKFTLNYDASVLSEFVKIGIFSPAGGATSELSLVDLKIRPTRLSMQL